MSFFFIDIDENEITPTIEDCLRVRFYFELKDFKNSVNFITNGK